MSKPLILELLNNRIVEKGSNANGSYTKYANGLLIQQGMYKENDVEFGIGCRDFFRCMLKQFNNFPIPFVGDKEDVSVFVEIQNISTEEIAFVAKYGSSSGNNAPTLTNPGKFAVIKEFNSNADIRVSYVAFGKWK